MSNGALRDFCSLYTIEPFLCACTTRGREDAYATRLSTLDSQRHLVDRSIERVLYYVRRAADQR